MNQEKSREVLSFFVAREPSIDRRCRPKPTTSKPFNLFKFIQEDEDENFNAIESSSSSSSSVTDSENALVFLRMRPLFGKPPSSNYSIRNKELITSQNCGANTTANIVEKHFSFNDIFDEHVSQYQIYERCIHNNIHDETNFSTMAYGTSGSGKTFTLLGDLNNPGIIPRGLEHIFEKYSHNLYEFPSAMVKNGEIVISSDSDIKQTLRLKRNLLGNLTDIQQQHDTVKSKIMHENKFDAIPKENESIIIYCSFMEIYNEVVRDLLDPNNIESGNNMLNYNKKTGLKIILNDGKVFVKDLTTVFVKSSLEAYKLLIDGIKKVSYATTGVNENSSRSHCIYMIDIIKYNHPDIFTHIQYKFCDLAGSERLGKTGNKGSRLKEQNRINTSLLVLGRCLEAAYSNQNKKAQDVIPYRESKLTMLLQASLFGKEKLTMVVNITPTSEYYEENLNVLGFSSIAQNIIYKHNEHKPQQKRFSWITNPISKGNQELEYVLEQNVMLQNEIEKLNDVIENMKHEMLQQEIDIRSEIVERNEKETENRNARWEQRLKIEKAGMEKTHTVKMESLRNAHRREIEAKDEEIEEKEEEIEEKEQEIKQKDKEIANLRKQLENISVKTIKAENCSVNRSSF